MKRGDIVQLGPHRLMCGDCADPKDTARLFNGQEASLVFTSPPYLNKRVYGNEKSVALSWDSLMMNCFSSAPMSLSCQILVNLGMCHSKGQWLPYWEPWLLKMQLAGWRRFGFYVWDTNMALPGHAHGRLLSRHEFIFHLNKTTIFPKKIVATKHGGKCKIHGRKVAVCPRQKEEKQNWVGRPYAMSKPLDSIIKATRSCVRGVNHPAKFPKSLALQIISSYSAEKGMVYDPFLGSGTSLLACDDLGRPCVAMEIEPAYCEISVQRYRKHVESAQANLKPKRKVVTA